MPRPTGSRVSTARFQVGQRPVLDHRLERRRLVVDHIVLTDLDGDALVRSELESGVRPAADVERGRSDERGKSLALYEVIGPL